MKEQRFDEFVADALYGPDGFYTSGRGSAGRRGDFITSPEVGPLFGAVVGRWLDSVWDDLGQPERFVVFDLGSGPGTLPKAIVRSAPRCGDALQLSGIDIARAGELPEDLRGSVIVANELLDNVPFRWIRDEAEAFVVDGQLQWHPTTESKAVGDHPLIEQAAALVSGLMARGVERLLAFDYGALTTQALADRGGWLRCYRDHQHYDDPVAYPGHQDITTDIPVDQLPAGAAVCTQSEFLRRHGIDELVEQGRAYWAEHASRPDLRAIEMRSRVNEAAALTDPTSLGAFLAMEWHSLGE